MVVKTMRVNDVQPLDCNPPSRTDEEHILDLSVFVEDRMRRGLPPLPDTERLLLGRDGILGDGHRRLAALKMNGVETVEIEVDQERTALEIYRDRGSAKSPTPKQIAQAALRGLSIEFFPPRQRANAETLIRLVGQEGLDYVISKDGQVSLTVHRQLSAFLSWLDRRNDQDFALKLLRWMVEHRSQRALRILIETSSITPRTVIRAVEENRRIRGA